MNARTPAPAGEVNRKWALFWKVVAVLFFGFFLVRTTRFVRDDFIAYYNAGARAWEGISPYAREETPFRYLPSTSFFFVPFSFLPLAAARAIFFALNFAAVVGIYAFIRRRAGDLAALLLAVLFFRFHNHDFGNAQVNPVLLALFFYWWEARERSLASASLAFSVFGSFKLMPFALGLPMLARSRWREIAWIAIWTVVLNFLPIFFFADGPFVFRDWYAEAKLIDDPVMLPNVQSFQAALWWILEGRMDPGAYKTLFRFLQAAALVGVLVLAPARNRDAWRVAGTLALTAIFSPLAWKHNYLQFLPLAFLWFVEDPAFAERRTRILYGVSLAGMVVLPSFLGAWNRGFADRLYLLPWTGLLVVFLGIALARRANPPD